MAILNEVWIILFLITVFLQIYFFRFRSQKGLEQSLSFTKDKSVSPNPALPDISIIICAKNEAGHLNQNLPVLLQQDYPSGKWEVIVVNDASTDGSQQILKDFQQRFHQLKIITIPASEKRIFPGKKFALHHGISNAAFDTVLLTDADCQPVSRNWLAGFAQYKMENEKKIILGYGAYERQSGFLNKLIQWETLETCIQYMGMCLSGLPYMGVGRNLMYEKRLYFSALENKIFLKKYNATPSGDDDLLIAQIANAANTGVCINPDTFVYSTPQKTFSRWMTQKSRHVSTGKYYPNRIKFILGMTGLTRSLFYILWLSIIVKIVWRLSFAMPAGLTLWLILFVTGIFRITVYWSNAKRWYAHLSAKKLSFFYPFTEICLCLIQISLSPYIFWKNKKQWK